ncbi:acyltransferase family protein [Sphingomonas sp. Mn802worker]|uniref:acyltransferase family protein n=1 Tax=Sphingomonas sp. Mn802worker TaxID=629773 RepID=UPI00138AD2FE|nr:acyltransferase [Sphingomonas sp. Mn802worker]
MRPDPPARHLSGRHYGLDWLRIGAFALLILYHATLVFVPGHWVIKWPETNPALVVPLAFLTPWRLPLLFAVSGFATRRLMMRSRSLHDFARGRSKRLLLPLGFGLLVLLVPELWVRAKLAGDPLSLPRYWLHEYWLPDPRYGLGFPAWEHLWFVQYLWVYTMLLTLLVAARGSGWVQERIEAATAGARILWVPIALLAAARLSLMFVVPEQHGLFTDWSGHVQYVSFLLFGFALGESPLLWQRIGAHWRGGVPFAAACGCMVAWVEQAYPGSAVPSHLIAAAGRAAQVAMSWSMLLILLHAADRWMNRDARWRATLAEGVFPAYLIHHPVIVVTTWAILPLGLPASAGFAVVLTTTIAACVGFYLLARVVPVLRPFAGLGVLPPAPSRMAVAAE